MTCTGLKINKEEAPVAVLSNQAHHVQQTCADIHDQIKCKVSSLIPLTHRGHQTAGSVSGFNGKHQLRVANGKY